jgi:hypothetical protein
LLINKVKAGDIPPDTLIVITRYINFPFITAEDARKAVIKAGNTALKVNEVPTAIL